MMARRELLIKKTESRTMRRNNADPFLLQLRRQREKSPTRDYATRSQQQSVIVQRCSEMTATRECSRRLWGMPNCTRLSCGGGIWFSHMAKRILRDNIFSTANKSEVGGFHCAVPLRLFLRRAFIAFYVVVIKNVNEQPSILLRQSGRFGWCCWKF